MAVATWQEWLEAAEDHRKAAVSLSKSEPPRVRGCLSRAYYAVYAACCAWFELLEEDGLIAKQAAPQGGGPWWPHQCLDLNLRRTIGLPSLAEGQWEHVDAEELVRTVVRLRNLRVDADYHPEVSHSSRDALDACRVARDLVERLRGAAREVGGRR